jgi:penicillin-insensitive murein endopeptidase
MQAFPSRRKRLIVLAVLTMALLSGHAAANGKRELPERFSRLPYSVMSLTVGHPNAGWQLRAKRLRSAGPLRVKPNSVQHTYGHPALVLMLQRSAKQLAHVAPGSILVVGDLSSKQGGPLAGHMSHQSGRDADVAFYARDARGRMLVPSEFVRFAENGKARDGREIYFDDWRNWLLVQAWVKDHRAGLSHIFVAAWLRRRMLGYAAHQPAFRKYVARASLLLKQPEDSAPHDDHFHVRISCPRELSDICREESR